MKNKEFKGKNLSMNKALIKIMRVNLVFQISCLPQSFSRTSFKKNRETN